MSVLTRIIDGVDDRLNPIVVKELRQAVQSRFVIVMLMAFLTIDVIVIMAGAISQDLHGSAEAGRGIFVILESILLAACMGFLPIYSAIRLASEHGDGNTDLFFITTIRAGAIIRGKFVAAMVLAMTMYGACMPFMVFTYLLRGIDLPTIFFILGMILLATAEAVMLALLLAAVPVGRVLRAFLGLGLLGAMVLGSGATVGISVAMIEFGIVRSMSGEYFWPALATGVGLCLAALGLMYLMAERLLSPRSSNRAMAPRICMGAVWAAALVTAIVWEWVMGPSTVDGPVRAWVHVCSAVLAASIFMAVSERDEIGPRVRAAIPSSRLLQVLAFPFISGSAGGIAWCALFAAGTLLAGYLARTFMSPLAVSHWHNYMAQTLVQMSCFLIWCYAYAMTGSLLRRLLFPRLTNGFNGVFGLIALAMGCFLPWVLGFFLYTGDDYSVDLYLIANPLAGMSLRAGQNIPPALVLGVIWAFVVTLLSLPWLLRQVNQFRPLKAQPRPQEVLTPHG